MVEELRLNNHETCVRLQQIIVGYMIYRRFSVFKPNKEYARKASWLYATKDGSQHLGCTCGTHGLTRKRTLPEAGGFHRVQVGSGAKNAEN